jgi:hypothetical protein
MGDIGFVNKTRGEFGKKIQYGKMCPADSKTEYLFNLILFLPEIRLLRGYRIAGRVFR